MTSLPRLPRSAPFEAGEIDALNSVLSATSAEQRSWLSGFLAGLDAARTPANERAAPAPKASAPLLVLYASESGNAEGLAYDLRKRATRQGFAARVVDMAEVTPAEAAAASNLLVIASTWGEGDPPDRAAPFYRALMAEDAPRFDGARFAVLALGDSAYANFCETGRRIDERLAFLGGERVAERIDCDLDFEEASAAWTEGALTAVREAAGPAESTVVHVAFAAEPAEAATWSRTAPFEAEITELVNLSGSRSTKETWHVELSLAGSGIRHEPGDSLGIVPRNDPALVDTVMEVAGVADDAGIRADLTERFEITTLTPPVVERYAALTGDPDLTRTIEAGELRAFVEGRHLIDLLASHPHRLTGEQLTGLLRPLPARLYSIASSEKEAPDEAHLLVGMVRYEAHGRPRKGVTSGFVAERRRPGDRLAVYLKPNRHFRLPTDPTTPIVMIGPGTGVAPFRAFVQERGVIGATGPSWLFFGDRTYTHDFLYQLEWQELLKEGALTRLDVAFSRDQPEKVYVQHRLWEQRADLWAWLEDGAHLYVCGDEKQMAKDVHAMLAGIVADRGSRDAEAAEAYLADLKRQGRYQRDVY